jgi:hypothetical protein
LVQDLDPVTVTWDFDDGRGLFTGTSASWAFPEPGLRTIRVRATDADGATTELTHPVLVLDTPDAPVIQSIAPQRLSEQTEWTYTIVAIDPDAEDVLEYSLNGAPAGMTVDSATGEIRWTPTRAQAAATYRVTAIVQDQTGLQATALIQLDVDRWGQIEGLVFEDLNRNGIHDVGEPLLAGISVELDAGRGGPGNRVAVTDADGRYRFQQLGVGAYEVSVRLPAFWEATAPAIQRFELTTGQELAAVAVGATRDSDGDGISNEDELTRGLLDANGDGIPDWQQGHVATVQFAEGRSITLIGPLGSMFGGIQISSLPAGAPASVLTEYGLLSYQISGLPIGGRASIELRLSGGPAISAVYKYGPMQPGAAAAWYPLPASNSGSGASAEVAVDRAILTLVDGQQGDADWEANGVIVDPLAFAFTEDTGHDPGWTNPNEPLDVNADGKITPLDVLLIINRLNLGDESLDQERLPGEPYYDVNSDRLVTPGDVLLVINHLNRRTG